MYYIYLLRLYDALATLDASLGADALAAIADAWPPIPRADALFLAAHEPPAPLWRTYLGAVEAVIRRYARDVPLALSPARCTDQTGGAGR